MPHSVGLFSMQEQNHAKPCHLSQTFLLILPSPVTTVPVAFSVGPQLTLNVANPLRVRLEDKQRSRVLKHNPWALPPQCCSVLPHLQPHALGLSSAAHHGQWWAFVVGLSPQAGGCWAGTGTDRWRGLMDRSPHADWTREGFMGFSQPWQSCGWLQSLRNGSGQRQREGQYWIFPRLLAVPHNGGLWGTQPLRQATGSMDCLQNRRAER